MRKVGGYMDKLKTIYIILSNLEDGKHFEASKDLTEEEIRQAIKIMVNDELVTLRTTKLYVNQEPDEIYDYDNLEITMKGLQYRKENSKISKTIKMIKDVKGIIK
jgi:hypothetical protein